jgi:hypothetical protein
MVGKHFGPETVTLAVPPVEPGAEHLQHAKVGSSKKRLAFNGLVSASISVHQRSPNKMNSIPWHKNLP